jgi:hypothetical protein
MASSQRVDWLGTYVCVLFCCLKYIYITSLTFFSPTPEVLRYLTTQRAKYLSAYFFFQPTTHLRSLAFLIPSHTTNHHTTVSGQS